MTYIASKNYLYLPEQVQKNKADINTLRNAFQLEYSDTTYYFKPQIVSVEGVAYIALRDTPFKGHYPPTSPDYWAVFAAGPQGINPNLLINPNFAINQRGQTSYTGAVYGVDRWKGIGTNVTAKLVANGIQLLSASVTSNTYIKQIVETNLAGKTVTASCKLSAINSGEGGRLAVYYSTDGTSWTLLNGITITTAGISSLTVSIPANAVYVSYDLGIRPNSDVVYEWSKLELGSVRTEFLPPDNATELIKCQRYYFDVGRNDATSYLIGAGVFYNATLAYVVIPLPITLRKSPTVILGDLSRLTLLSNGKSYTPTEITLLGTNNNAVSLRYTVTGATSGNGCAARLVNSANNNAGILAFDAEL